MHEDRPKGRPCIVYSNINRNKFAQSPFKSVSANTVFCSSSSFVCDATVVREQSPRFCDVVIISLICIYIYIICYTIYILLRQYDVYDQKERPSSEITIIVLTSRRLVRFILMWKRKNKTIYIVIIILLLIYRVFPTDIRQMR